MTSEVVVKSFVNGMNCVRTIPPRVAERTPGSYARLRSVAVTLEAELQDLMERVAATDSDLAARLATAARDDPDASVDGVSKGALTTVDLLRIRGRLDGLREAVLRLAREIDARDA